MYWDRFISIIIKDEFTQIELNSENLDISFDCEKSKSKENNSGIVTVFNLSTTTVAQLTLTKEVKPTVTISAGHNSNGTQHIYTGDLVEFKTSSELGGDVKSELVLDTGYNAKQSAGLSKSFNRGVNLRTVIDYVVSNNKESITSLKVTSLKQVIWERGLVVSGNSYDNLCNILHQTGHEYTLEDNVLKISIKKQAHEYTDAGALTGGDVHLIESDERLIGIPEQITDSGDVARNDLGLSNGTEKDKETAVTKANTQNRAGFKTKVMLDGAYGVMENIILSSKRLGISNYVMTIDKVRHIGSSYDTPYYTEITGYKE